MLLYIKCRRERLHADLVDLHSVRVLQKEDFSLRSDQTGNGVDHSHISARLSWDLFFILKKELNLLVFKKGFQIQMRKTQVRSLQEYLRLLHELCKRDPEGEPGCFS